MVSRHLNLMSGHSFKIGVANQANPKMQNNGGLQNGDQPVSGLHFSARHFSAVWVRVPCLYNVS
jgi:hypothetical protein